jgi:MFS family permease
LPAVLGRRPKRARAHPTTEFHNYQMMRGDSIAMGIINSVVPFLPVFIVRLGGSEFEVSLLTAIPAVCGFLLAIPLGQFLQGKPRIVPWYSGSRMVAHLSYAVAAVVVLLAPREAVVPALLVVWAIAAVPSTLGMVAFPIVMDGAAGPRGRYEIMGRRWAIMGLTTAITVAIIGQLLDSLPFPANYQIIFVGFTLAGLVSFRFSSRFRVPDHPPRPHEPAVRRLDRLRQMARTVRSEPAFLRYSARQLVYVVGTRFALPLIPLYYVREVGAPDSWIGIIATGQALALLVGYQVWRKVSVARGGILVLLVTLFVYALYPAALSLVDELILVAGVTAIAAVFSAGVDLALFDELMKRIPRPYGVTFTSIDTALVNAASILAPVLGAATAVALGVAVALQLASLIGLLGVILFALDSRRARTPSTIPEDVVAPA